MLCVYHEHMPMEYIVIQGRSIIYRTSSERLWKASVIYSLSWYYVIVTHIDLLWRTATQAQPIHMVLLYIHTCFMMILWHRNALCKTGPLWRESIGRLWIYFSNGPLMRICDVLFVVNLLKLLNCCLRFEIAWRPCDVSTMVFTKNIESKEI